MNKSFRTSALTAVDEEEALVAVDKRIPRIFIFVA
jgi:hypothetical protein